ncbi:DNA-directed RNA polymerase III subunit rpc9-like [Rhodamnia argentea]|uniref:DNA-directed RNA polymerase III subunit RPC9 n=1 Tax=Rhodamnia argentea TaxID=178133 RepID=A0A8B8QAB9_9MYRT|nr:DNA-directed RNA polymerase III subunit rpc9-like [Rhodamnia argentea]XP_030543464.1 DNA-directed RNA polymerase III subunit rpc9-like [Rhodamnia argentea]
MKIKNANDGAMTNFEVLSFLQSRGASKEVAATVAPSEYKVFQYLVDTAANKQTKESVSDLLGKVKKYDLAKAEVLNIINLSPTLPVGIYTIVEKCDARLGEDGAQELADIVAEVSPPPEQPRSEEGLPQANDV